jgi:transposase
MAEGRRVATHPPCIARRIAGTRPTRFGAHHRRQFFGASDVRGEKTGPSPVDRRKLGSKHHLITEQKGIPLATILTGANTNDITQLLPLVAAIPAIAGKPGRPLRKPRIVQGDRGYDSEPARRILRQNKIVPELARRRTEHGSGLGKTRWVVERTIAWLHSFRRLKIRYEKFSAPHEAFLSLACALICWNFLKPLI